MIFNLQKGKESKGKVLIKTREAEPNAARAKRALRAAAFTNQDGGQAAGGTHWALLVGIARREVEPECCRFNFMYYNSLTSAYSAGWKPSCGNLTLFSFRALWPLGPQGPLGHLGPLGATCRHFGPLGAI